MNFKNKLKTIFEMSYLKDTISISDEKGFEILEFYVDEVRRLLRIYRVEPNVEIETLKQALLNILNKGYVIKIGPKDIDDHDDAIYVLNDLIKDNIVGYKNYIYYLEEPVDVDPMIIHNDLENKLNQDFKPTAWKSQKPIKRASKSGLRTAVAYHAKSMDGDRWEDLENAFKKISYVYSYTSGNIGDYTRPRSSVWVYMNNLNERWEEGEKLFIMPVLKRICYFIERSRSDILRLMKISRKDFMKLIEYLNKYNIKNDCIKSIKENMNIVLDYS